MRIGKLIFVVFISAHWTCCSWFFLGDMPEAELLPSGELVEGWVREKFPEYGNGNSTDYSMASLYFASFFWSSLSVIQVGNLDRDMLPKTVSTKIMHMTAFVIGTCIISVIIGQVSDMIAHANPGEKARTDAVGL